MIPHPFILSLIISIIASPLVIENFGNKENGVKIKTKKNGRR